MLRYGTRTSSSSKHFYSSSSESYGAIFLTYNLPLLCVKTSNTANDHFTTSSGFRITVISTIWLQITSSVYPHGDPRDTFESPHFSSFLTTIKRGLFFFFFTNIYTHIHKININVSVLWRCEVEQLVETIRYNPDDRRFDLPWGSMGIFFIH